MHEFGHAWTPPFRRCSSPSPAERCWGASSGSPEGASAHLSAPQSPARLGPLPSAARSTQRRRSPEPSSAGRAWPGPIGSGRTGPGLDGRRSGAGRGPPGAEGRGSGLTFWRIWPDVDTLRMSFCGAPGSASGSLSDDSSGGGGGEGSGGPGGGGPAAAAMLPGQRARSGRGRGLGVACWWAWPL